MKARDVERAERAIYTAFGIVLVLLLLCLR